MVSPSGARAVARCDELGMTPYSETSDGLYRPFLSKAHAAALRRITIWMQEAGMSVRLDAAANLIGRYEGAEPGAKALLIGSHIDTVRDGGRYDGPLGIMLGIEAVAALSESGKRPPFAIEIIAFGDEEGSRFPASMTCSRAIAGSLDPAALKVVDADGTSIGKARTYFEERIDWPAAWDDIKSAAYDPAKVLGYLEPHIEQGPVLEAEGLALSAVSGIAAQLRIQIEVIGNSGHAGTSIMRYRRDALAGAAAMVLAAESMALSSGGAVVATVGRIAARPGAVNVVPGAADFSLDIRSGDQAARDAVAARIKATFDDIASERGLELRWRQVQDLPASPCDPVLTNILEKALAAAGHKPRILVSGAGHDCMVMSGLCPTAMLFLRCAGGVSHNPAESVSTEDANAALQIMLGFIERLESNYA
jgi:allantoate deiminase